jgi:hypothetical protein
VSSIRRDRIERLAHSLAHAFPPIELSERTQHAGGIGALAAPRLQETARLTLLQQAVQQPLLGPSRDQPSAELAQDAEVEARIGQRQAERVLPIDPTPDRLGGLAVRQPFCELQHRHQCQPPGCFGRLATPREQVGEVFVGVDTAQRVPQLQARIATRERRSRHTHGLLGHGLDRFGMQRHRAAPAV